MKSKLTIAIPVPSSQRYHKLYQPASALPFKLSRTKSDTGYFVYVNGKTDRAAFDGKLEFDVQIIPYTGSDAWVEGAITAAHACLNRRTAPKPSATCSYCAYAAANCKE